MALYSMATDLTTRRTIWVATNRLARRPQLNSHRDDHFGRCYKRDGIDGFEAYDIAGLHTSYAGNDWESKYVAFVEKWAEVNDTEAATVG